MAGFKAKIKLLKALLTNDASAVAPFYLLVDATRRCNLNCPGCRFHSPYFNMPLPGDQKIDDLPPELFRKVCDELGAMGTRNMIFTGEGEPLLHPEICELISIAKRKGIHLSLFTNGTLFDEAKIRAFMDSGLDCLMVSLWANSQEEYERNYPGTNPDNFKKIVNSLGLISQLKKERKSKHPSVILHQPINRNNFKSLDKLVELVVKTGCNGVSFVPFNHRKGAADSFSLSRSQEHLVCDKLKLLKRRLNLLSLKHNIDYTLKRYKIGHAVWESLPCYIGWFYTRIKVDGTILPCGQCDLLLGNINNNSFSDIWNSKAYRDFRQKALTKEGLASMINSCDCGFCCHTHDNLRIHNIAKWLGPFLGAKLDKLESSNVS